LGVAYNGACTKQPERDPIKRIARAGSGCGRQRILKNDTANAAFQPANTNRRSRKLPLERSRRCQGVAPSRTSMRTTLHRERPMTRSQPGAEPTKGLREKGNRPVHEPVRRDVSAPPTGRAAENEPANPKRRPRKPFTAGNRPVAEETQKPHGPADNPR